MRALLDTDVVLGLLHYAAMAHGLDALVTRNRDDYQRSRIPVMTVEECVTTARNQGGLRGEN